MSYLPNRRLLCISAALGLLILGVLAGCALVGAPEPTPTPPPPTASPLPRGGNLTIRLAADVPELRPWQPRSRGEEQIVGLMYNGLMRLDPQLLPQPDLAERWDASADGRLITFTLRPALSWQDGRPLTADDAVFTLNALRAISPTTVLLSDLRRIADVAAPTTRTLVISLTERYAPILSELAVPILPRHLLSGKDLATLNFWDVPIGSGPFSLNDRQPGAAITLVANRRYFRGAPLLDRVAFLLSPDLAVTQAALKDGRLLLSELPWAASRAISQTLPGIRAGAYPENGYYFLAFNTREGRAFADVRLRQALALAVDQPALVRQATDGQGIPIASSAVPGSWASFVRPQTGTLDLDAARALLDDAGWTAGPDGVRQREGRPLEAQIFVRGDDQRRVAAAQRIAEAGRTIGISLTVQPADFASVIVSKYAPPYDFDLLLGSWSNGAGDPDYADYAYYDPDDFALFHSSQINQGVADTRPVRNIGGFRDAPYDNQAAAAHQLYDTQQRGAALRLAQERLDDQKPYLFLWADRTPVALSPTVATLDGPVDLNTPMYLWNVERWYLNR